jgi:hypothetical protein
LGKIHPERRCMGLHPLNLNAYTPNRKILDLLMNF